MMIVILIILIVIIFLAILSIYRLNLYISELEEKIEKSIELSQNLKQSLKELVIEGFLLDDGRLKKMIIQREKDIIYNGENILEL